MKFKQMINIFQRNSEFLVMKYEVLLNLALASGGNNYIVEKTCRTLLFTLFSFLSIFKPHAARILVH